jgi:hypothetical protein
MTDNKKNLENIKARRLGVACSSVLAIAAWICLLQEISGAFFFSFGATLLLTISLLKPSLLKIPRLLWCGVLVMRSRWPIKGLLFLGYFLIVTPISLVSKIMGRNLFSERILQAPRNYWTTPRDSYWEPKQQTNVHTMRW